VYSTLVSQASAYFHKAHGNDPYLCSAEHRNDYPKFSVGDRDVNPILGPLIGHSGGGNPARVPIELMGAILGRSTALARG
jgi:hypothetical protein